MQARSERTRHRLLRAAADLIDRYGYANATLGQIAAAAGLTKGALYFHFASKDGLADAVQEQGRTMLRDFVREQREAGVPPVQVLIDLTHWLARALHEEPLIRAGFRITYECADRPVADFHQVWIDEVRHLLDLAEAAGETRVRAGDGGAEALLSALLCGIGDLAGTSPRHALRIRMDALWDLLLPVLVPPGETGRYRTRPPGVPRPAEAAA